MSALLKTTYTIVTYNNNKGIKRDIEILTACIQKLGYPIRLEVKPFPVRSHLDILAVSNKAKILKVHWLACTVLRIIKIIYRIWENDFRDIKIFLEILPVQHFFDNSYKVFIPNPEWLDSHDEWKLPFLNLILCKSKQATNAFSKDGLPAHYLGFISIDSHIPNITPNRSRYLHLASSGCQKGTAEILNAWSCHPEWPLLTVLAGKCQLLSASAENVEIITNWISDNDLCLLMQQCGVHVCCSNAEAFGHTIVEGMSCGALVITTDYPPMNELIDNSRGILVTVDTDEVIDMRRGKFVMLNVVAIEQAINLSIAMSDEDFETRCRNARSWFEIERKGFEDRLTKVLRCIQNLV
jgi:glycosyltransferase involved in cell wall biosynthesis